LLYERALPARPPAHHLSRRNYWYQATEIFLVAHPARYQCVVCTVRSAILSSASYPPGHAPHVWLLLGTIIVLNTCEIVINRIVGVFVPTCNDVSESIESSTSILCDASGLSRPFIYHLFHVTCVVTSCEWQAVAGDRILLWILPIVVRAAWGIRDRPYNKCVH